ILRKFSFYSIDGYRFHASSDSDSSLRCLGAGGAASHGHDASHHGPARQPGPTGRQVARGLAKIATLIRQARAGNANTLLIDCGGTIQGTPLEDVYQSVVHTGADPAGHRPEAK